MRVAQTILDTIGDTPLVQLNHVTEGIAATVLAKVEYVNPGGSVKDRIAIKIIDAAEAEGKLKPGGTIVEPTSGNTGVGLALVAQQRGYRCIFVCPDKVGEDKVNVLKAYGAEVVMTPSAVAPEDPRSYYSVSDRLAEEIEGAYKPNQYENLNGPASHYESTGPEIWADTDGKVTHFVAGIGTGGTISGTGRYLREVGDVTVIGADPVGSIYAGGEARPYLVEGVGEDMWPGAYDTTVPHRIISVTDAQSLEMTVRLAREEGLLVGGSSGMAVVAALEAARELGPDDVVVVLLPDGGRGYLAKIFNEGWMSRHGFAGDGEGATVRQVLDARSGGAPDLVHVGPDATVRQAIDTMSQHGVSQLLVLSAEPPVMMGEVVGALTERGLLAALAGGAAGGDSISDVVGPALPLIGLGASVESARAALEDADALLVTEGGKPVGVLTRPDLLAFLSR